MLGRLGLDDALVVVRIDRLARSLSHLLAPGAARQLSHAHVAARLCR
jgi:hypothetical protein